MLGKFLEFMLKGLLNFRTCEFYFNDIACNIDLEEERLIDLRKQGKTQKEISEITGLTINQVKGRIQKLIKAGKVERVR